MRLLNNMLQNCKIPLETWDVVIFEDSENAYLYLGQSSWDKNTYFLNIDSEDTFTLKKYPTATFSSISYRTIAKSENVSLYLPLTTLVCNMLNVDSPHTSYYTPGDIVINPKTKNTFMYISKLNEDMELFYNIHTRTFITSKEHNYTYIAKYSSLLLTLDD